MCGGCGAGSARTAAQHWSAPFLASVPARTAAARTLIRWTRATGWSGTVSGVAGGFEVATASGRRWLAGDLAATLARLSACGVRSDRLLDQIVVGVVEGPPTWPGLRLRPRAPETASDEPGWTSVDPFATKTTRCVLPPDPRRRYRVPALLTWLAVAERTDALVGLVVHLGLGETEGLLLTSGGGLVSCSATPAPGSDVVLGAERASTTDRAVVLSPLDVLLIGT